MLAAETYNICIDSRTVFAKTVKEFACKNSFVSLPDGRETLI